MVREGKVYAIAGKPWHEDLPHTLFSLSKSFCSMAAGMAVYEGLLSYDDSVADVLRDSLPEGYDPALQEVKLRHLLSMSSGLDPMSDQRSLRGKRDWAGEVLGFKVLHEPGTHFHYNTLGTYLAGRMVGVRAGMSLRDYLMPRLFIPLGITKPAVGLLPHGLQHRGLWPAPLLHWISRKPRSCCWTAAGGVGKQLLNASYLDLATRKQVDNRMRKLARNRLRLGKWATAFSSGWRAMADGAATGCTAR